MIFENDICWCLDGEYCGHLECLRNICHKDSEEYIFTCGALMGTNCCIMTEEEKEK